MDLCKCDMIISQANKLRKYCEAMISFIWTDQNPMYSGRGGTENFTAGQIRELTIMGIDARVITVGQHLENSSSQFTDISFWNVPTINDLEKLDDTIIFVNVPFPIETKNRSFCIFHCPPRLPIHLRAEYKAAMENKTAIVASKYMQNLWSNYLGLPKDSIHVAYPFADPHFAKATRTTTETDITTVLFAGRLVIEKGIYLYLESMHHDVLESGYIFSATTAGNQTFDGKKIEESLKNDSKINLINAKHNPREMAELLAENRILVMPSNSFFWHEGFGMLSVEAQHAGCEVIASNDGGLPETDCGGLTLFEPGNSRDLAETNHRVAQGNQITAEQQAARSQFFTRNQSAKNLLKILDQ